MSTPRSTKRKLNEYNRALNASKALKKRLQPRKDLSPEFFEYRNVK
jgi:hypothetical protein